MIYYYIKGKDPSNVQLLCRRDNSTVELNRKAWRLTASGGTHSNPLIIDNIPSVGRLEFVCLVGNTTILTIEFIIHGSFQLLFYLKSYHMNSLLNCIYSAVGYIKLYWI